MSDLMRQRGELQLEGQDGMAVLVGTVSPTGFCNEDLREERVVSEHHP